MNILSWNCRGAGNRRFANALSNILNLYQSNLIALLETKCSGQRDDKVIQNLGFDNNIRVKARGFAGVIWLMWNKPNIRVMQSWMHTQFLHVKLAVDHGSPWFLTIVYASPIESERKEVWHELQQIANTMSDAWLVIGDFNEIASLDEKKGGAETDRAKCQRFADWMNRCGLIDMGSSGTPGGVLSGIIGIEFSKGLIEASVMPNGGTCFMRL